MTTTKRSALFLVLAGALLMAGLATATRAASDTNEADEPAFAAANALVDAGHYAEAAQMYEQLETQGTVNASLLYNLGNAYFLQGDAGRAQSVYERAARLAPRDADIRHNLELARRQAGGSVASRPAGLPAQVATVAGRWLAVDELALVALGAWFLFGFLVVAYRHLRPGRNGR